MSTGQRRLRRIGKRLQRPKLVVELLEPRHLLASDWQNPLYELDVNDDSVVSPRDALLIINSLNQFGSGRPASPVDLRAEEIEYLDTSGDGFITPVDALLVINAINLNLPLPSIQIGLERDSGLSDTDRITFDPTVLGTFTPTSAAEIVGAKVRVNRLAVSTLSLQPGNTFRFDPRTLPEVNEGSMRVSVAVALAGGATAVKHFSLTYDAIAPQFRPPALMMEDDSGLSDQDNVTNIINPRLTVFAEPGSLLEVRLNELSLVREVAAGTWTSQLPLAADGVVDVFARATDVAGNVSEPLFPTRITLDTTSPTAVNLRLAPSSDTGARGDGRTSAGRVTLLGSTEPQAIVSIEGTDQSQRASTGGLVQFTNVPLVSGLNTRTIRVVDLAGNVGPSTAIQLERVGDAASQDVVSHWNAITLESIRQDASDPLMASRTLAMVSAAVLDVVQAFDGLPAYWTSQSAPLDFSPDAAIATAAFEVLDYAFPTQHDRLIGQLNSWLATIADGPAKDAAVGFGRDIAREIIQLRTNDGWDRFVSKSGTEIAGRWQETSPFYAVALRPQWGEVTPWMIDKAENYRPAGPPDLTSVQYASAFNEVAELGRVDSSLRTQEQTNIALFWANGPGTPTPPGHWNAIANQVAQASASSISDKARMLAMLNVALADAAIVAWDTKYVYDFWRPVTAIAQADRDDNQQTTADANWAPLLITPPFPEYTSGHSTFSGAAAEILTDQFGDAFPFSARSEGSLSIDRSFTSFRQAAEESGRSRIYGGIHFDFSNHAGLSAGRDVGRDVLSRFSSLHDRQAPTVSITSPAASGDSFSATPTITGRVIDRQSGVRQLIASLDDGVTTTVSFDSLGRFTFTPNLPVSNSTQGIHSVRLRAIDNAGNASSVNEVRFVLDSAAPTIDIQSPQPGASLTAGMVIAGTAQGTGSAIVALSYRFNDGVERPLLFDATTGNFRQPLALSKLPSGTHRLTVTARDAAGLVASNQISVALNAPIPFSIASVSPAAGSIDVGSTVRPQVFFTRPVNPTTLSQNNLYLTGPNGQKLPARIVLASDGSFAWLFLEQPMPGGSRITLHIDSGTILASDGTVLDADGNGLPGGTKTFAFETLSLTPLMGTSLSGRVLDPGIDRAPMTVDDIRSGPDRALHTDDDLFLNPLIGVEVYVLGLESQKVFTDSQGRFQLDRVPAGNVKLVVDGRVASNAPTGVFFPEMVMDLNLRAGQANTVMGTMGPIEQQLANLDRQEVYLPRLNQSMLSPINSSGSTTVTVKPGDAPGLTPEQRQRLTINVPAGQAIGHDGLPMADGQIGISTVPPELVRDMLPPGLLQHTFDITIQAPGVDRFTTPVSMTFPNLMDAAPGSKLNFLSFDHTTGRLVIEGTATVSADGRTVSTDPDTGITHPGWHGLVPPGSLNGMACANNSTDAGTVPVRPVPVTRGLEDRFFFTDNVQFVLGFGNRASSLNPFFSVCDPINQRATPLVVELKVDGPVSSFLDGLSSQTFELLPGQAKDIQVFAADLLPQLQTFEVDKLFGVTVTVSAYPKGDQTNKLIDQKFHIYRLVDATDATLPLNAIDARLEFPDTIVDGFGNIVRQRKIEYDLPASSKPEFSILSQHFDVNAAGDLIFDPQTLGENLSATAQVITPEGKVVGAMQLVGDGTPKIKLDLNQAQFDTMVAAMLTDAQTPGDDVNPVLLTEPERAVLSTDALRNAFFQDLATEATKAFAAVSPGIELGSGNNSIVVNWLLNSNVTSYGHSGKPLPADGVDIGLADGDTSIHDTFNQDVPNFLNNMKGQSRAAQNFTLSELMNQSFQTNISVYFDNVLESPSGGFLNLTRDQMLQAIKKVVVHEAAHTLGLMHTAATVYDQGASLQEEQRISLSGAAPGSKFRLSFNGQTTQEINFDSTEVGVRNELEALSSIGFGNVSVTAPRRGGPYTIQFQGDFRTLDVPQITGTGTGGLTVQSTTLQNGRSRFAPQSVQGGTTDIMYGGRLDPAGVLKFQPGLSQDGLRVGLHLDWTPNEAQNLATFWANQFKASGGSFFDAEDIEDLGGAFLPGPHVFAVDDQNNQLFRGLDFGSIQVDGSDGLAVTKTIQLFNIGTLPVVIHALAVQSPSGAFKLSSVAPGTSIASGGSMEFSVTFDPMTSGADKATLSIETNDPSIPTRVKLNGSGKALVADLSMDVANNNMAGSMIGVPVVRADAIALTNRGGQPLTITNVKFVDSSEFTITGLPAGFGPQSPLVLAPDQSINLSVRFAPGAQGLRNSMLEVFSNDPDTPIARKLIVGTGISPDQPSGRVGNDFVAVEQFQLDGAPVLRQRSDDAGRWGFVLAPDRAVHHVVFDPQTGLVSHGYDRAIATFDNLSNSFTAPFFLPSVASDSDEDGLPDDIEFAIGSSLQKPDTDGDGLSDAVEIAQGLDPLGNLDLPLGIVSALTFQGQATAVALLTDPAQTSNPLAIVATGVQGLAIVDVLDPTAPVLISQLGLPGLALDVAVDPVSRLAYVAAGAAGVYVVDVSNPVAPALLATLPTGDSTDRLALRGDRLFANAGRSIVSIDTQSMTIRESLPSLPDIVTSMEVENDLLLVATQQGMLHAISTDTGLVLQHSEQLPTASISGIDREDDVAWLAVQLGAMSVDIQNPADLQLISDVDKPREGNLFGTAIAVSGSGLGLLAQHSSTPIAGVPGSVLDTIHLGDPSNTFELVNRIDLPGSMNDLAIGAGYALATSAQFGLQILNFQNMDTGIQAPDVTLITTSPDADPARQGMQIESGAALRLRGRVSDDVLVRGVELWVGAQRVAYDIEYPWEFSYRTPWTNSPLQLQMELRAFDTGGNLGKSQPLIVDVIPDTQAPRLISSTPSQGQVIGQVSRIDLNFDEVLDPARLNISGLSLIEFGIDTVPGSADDLTIPIDRFQLATTGRSIAVFPVETLGPGTYRLTADTSIIADLAGNQLGTDVELNFAVPTTGSLVAHSGFPTDPNQPSANPRQEIAIKVDWAPEAARLAITRIQNNGVRYTDFLRPNRSDGATRTAYFKIPDDALTGNVTLFGSGTARVADLPHWTVTSGGVDVIGLGTTGGPYNDHWPGNGLYVEFGAESDSPNGLLQSRTNFDLQPGQYELSFDLAGSRGSFFESVEVGLGSLFNETLSRPVRAPFARQTRIITVDQPTSARLTFGHIGRAIFGLLMDNVRLTRIDSGQVLFNDAFELPVVDPTFPLQIVPVIERVDTTSATSQSMAVAITGLGFIEAENTRYQFGEVSIVDSSVTGGPDVRDDPSTQIPLELNRFVTMTVERTANAFGQIVVETAGGRSEPYAVSLDRVISTAFSGTADLAATPSANAGQSVWLEGSGLSLASDFVVDFSDEGARNASLLINPTWTSADGSRAQLILPLAVNGLVTLRMLGASSYPIQIVPVVTGDIVDNATAQIRLLGRGFQERDSLYDFEFNRVVDTSDFGLPDVLSSGTVADINYLPPVDSKLVVATSAGRSAEVLVNAPLALPDAPILTSIELANVNGTPANSSLSAANTGQVIILVGSNFRLDGMQAVFPIRDEDGIAGFEGVAPLAVNAAGTRAEVRVPDLAVTGEVRVTAIGGRNYGFGAANDMVHRNVRASFVPQSSTVQLRFADGGLTSLSDESWGLDNVRVLQGNTPVYSEDFQEIGSEWSLNTQSSQSSFGQFSGPFSTAVQRLTLNGLTPGTTYQLLWDLLVLDSWDGMDGLTGPDRFLVTANGQNVFDAAFSNQPGKSQTYTSGPGQVLQVVPTITGIEHSLGTEYESLRIDGSGFTEGQATIQFGGVTVQDFYSPSASVDPDVVAGSRNKRYIVGTDSQLTPFTLEGPLRVSTDGGYDEIVGHDLRDVSPQTWRGIQAAATAGTPHNPARPSANTAQKIQLFGAFSSNVYVEFPAIDDSGRIGTVIRRADRIGTDIYGRTYEIAVPEMARSGPVRVLGAPGQYDLQVVPTLTAAGPLVPGQLTVLEGTGLLKGDLNLTIDGIAITDFQVKTLRDHDDFRVLPDRQIVTFIVPNGIDAGVIQAVTSGGRVTLQTHVARTAGPLVQPLVDAGDTRASALPVATQVNQRFTLRSMLESRPEPDGDTDWYQYEFNAGDQVVFDVVATSTMPPGSSISAEFFDSAGARVGESRISPDNEQRINYRVAQSGSYYLSVTGDGNVPYDVHIRRIAAGGTLLSGITATAASGTARHSSLPSANTGQTITLLGSGFRSGERVVFTSDDDEPFFMAPISVAADGSSLTVQVPNDSRLNTLAISGRVRLDTETVGLFLQVVPTIDRAEISLIVTPGERDVALSGSGFDTPSTVHVGAMTFDRAGEGTRMDLNLIESPMGPIKLETLGGTSPVLLGPDMVSLDAVAASGTPANPALPSANPLQTIVVRGNRLSTSTIPQSRPTPLIFAVIDANGVRGERIVVPTAASADGREMTVTVPSNAITAHVGILGDPEGTTFLLQIVPTVASVVAQTGNIQLNGSGFIEGATFYQIGTLEILDGSVSSAGVNVRDNAASRNNQANIAKTLSGSGQIIVTTAGGSSAPLSFGSSSPLSGEGEANHASPLPLAISVPAASTAMSRSPILACVSPAATWPPGVARDSQALLNLNERDKRNVPAIDLVMASTLGAGSLDTRSVDEALSDDDFSDPLTSAQFLRSGLGVQTAKASQRTHKQNPGLGAHLR